MQVRYVYMCCEVTLDIGYIVIQLFFLMQHILQRTRCERGRSGMDQKGS